MQSQDCMMDVAEHPNKVLPIFDNCPLKCVDMRCRDEIQYIYDLPILDASFASNCLIYIVVGNIHWNQLFC